MSDFSLIKSLQTENDKTKLPRGHQYVNHEVMVEGESIPVKIPEKEFEGFKVNVAKHEKLDKYQFNKIMREVRGIRG